MARGLAAGSAADEPLDRIARAIATPISRRRAFRLAAAAAGTSMFALRTETAHACASCPQPLGPQELTKFCGYAVGVGCKFACCDPRDECCTADGGVECCRPYEGFAPARSDEFRRCGANQTTLDRFGPLPATFEFGEPLPSSGSSDVALRVDDEVVGALVFAVDALIVALPRRHGRSLAMQPQYTGRQPGSCSGRRRDLGALAFERLRASRPDSAFRRHVRVLRPKLAPIAPGPGLDASAAEALHRLCPPRRARRRS